jgi:hypothetical protein
LIRHETEITAHTPIILLGQASSPVWQRISRQIKPVSSGQVSKLLQ